MMRNRSQLAAWHANKPGEKCLVQELVTIFVYVRC